MTLDYGTQFMESQQGEWNSGCLRVYQCLISSREIPGGSPDLDPQNNKSDLTRPCSTQGQDELDTARSALLISPQGSFTEEFRPSMES